MGLFDRFKKNDNKKEEPKKKNVIPDDLEIDEDQLILKEIATKSKDRYERAAAADKSQTNMLHWTCQKILRTGQ